MNIRIDMTINGGIEMGMNSEMDTKLNARLNTGMNTGMNTRLNSKLNKKLHTRLHTKMNTVANSSLYSFIRRNTKHMVMIPSALVIVLLLSSCGTTIASSLPSPTPDANINVASSIEAFGVVTSINIQNISIPVQADVKNLNIRDGQLVSRNEILATIDISEVDLQIAQLEEEISTLKADILYTETQTTVNTSDMAKLQNEYNNAKRILAEGLSELAKKESLLSKELILQNEVDLQNQMVASQKKNLRDTEYAIAGTKEITGLSNEQKNNQLLQKNSQLKKLEMELLQLRTKLNGQVLQNGNIVSPISQAVVTEVAIRTGDRVNPGQKLFTLEDLEQLIVIADISEEFIKDVKPGMSVDIIPVSDKSKTYVGKISRISGIATTKNGQTMVQAEITLDNPDSMILPGFNVDIMILRE